MSSDGTRATFGVALTLTVVGLVVLFADGLNCLAGDCTTEPWIQVLVLVPAAVAVGAGVALLARRR